MNITKFKYREVTYTTGNLYKDTTTNEIFFLEEFQGKPVRFLPNLEKIKSTVDLSRNPSREYIIIKAVDLSTIIDVRSELSKADYHFEIGKIVIKYILDGIVYHPLSGLYYPAFNLPLDPVYYTVNLDDGVIVQKKFSPDNLSSIDIENYWNQNMFNSKEDVCKFLNDLKTNNLKSGDDWGDLDLSTFKFFGCEFRLNHYLRVDFKALVRFGLDIRSASRLPGED